MHFELYKNILSVYNYRQIKQLTNDLIELEFLSVIGSNLKIIRMDKDNIIIKGVIKTIQIGDILNDLQNSDEKK